MVSALPGLSATRSPCRSDTLDMSSFDRTTNGMRSRESTSEINTDVLRSGAGLSTAASTSSLTRQLNASWDDVTGPTTSAPQ